MGNLLENINSIDGKGALTRAELSSIENLSKELIKNPALFNEVDLTNKVALKTALLNEQENYNKRNKTLSGTGYVNSLLNSILSKLNDVNAISTNNNLNNIKTNTNSTLQLLDDATLDSLTEANTDGNQETCPITGSHDGCMMSGIMKKMFGFNLGNDAPFSGSMMNMMLYHPVNRALKLAGFDVKPVPPPMNIAFIFGNSFSQRVNGFNGINISNGIPNISSDLYQSNLGESPMAYMLKNLNPGNQLLRKAGFKVEAMPPILNAARNELMPLINLVNNNGLPSMINSSNNPYLNNGVNTIKVANTGNPYLPPNNPYYNLSPIKTYKI
nr:hypothetical protein [Candidatus Gracilibacteria bacterium]